MKKISDFGFITKNDVYVIAEIGINHGGDLEVAKQLINSAAKTGVDAVKFQTYITEKRAPKNSPEIFKILKQCELPFESFKILKNYSESKGIDFFSTPFDYESVDYLESIDCSLYKVASFDVVNHLLLNRIAETKKPIIMSVGMANLAEIDEAYDILKKHTNNIAILHCISAYPTKDEDANLAAIYSLRARYDCIIGQSDHTPDIKVPLYAVAAGARIIEKHYKIDHEMKCVDAPVSITENQMEKLVIEIRQLEEILGHGVVELTPAQKDIVQFRREKKDS